MSTPITLIGNLTSDPELKFFEGGTAKATASIAVNEYWTDKDGERQEKTSYFNLVAWRQTAEDMCRVASKGMRVIVVAKPEQRSWEDKDTGAKRSTVEFIVSEVGPSARGLDDVTRKQAAAQEGGAPRKPAYAGAKRPATSRQEIPTEEEPF
jgi:single-strand DNA-binding protein